MGRFPRRTDRPFPEVEGVTHRFVDVDGLRMHVAEAGEGDPLVMLHGWPQHWYEWRKQIPVLSKHYRVICPDLRGLGWTDAPPSGYDKETLAADIVKLLDALGLERVRLMGHDWGGWCGYIICLRHPERVERYLALNIPPPWGKIDLRSLIALPRFAYQWFLASPLGPRVLRSRPGFVRWFIRGFSPRKESWTEEDLNQFAHALQEPERARASQQIYGTFAFKEFPKIARGEYNSLRLTTPTLLLVGEQDPVVRKNLLRGYEPFVDDLKIEFFPDAGHFIVEEKPDVVNERALEFFGVPAGAPKRKRASF
jgi:pimeloyl-ACP methyl ester carboxylesterase